MDKYTFRTIANSEGAIILAVIYDGEFCEDGPVAVELLNNDVVTFQGTLSSDNTSVFFAHLVLMLIMHSKFMMEILS